MYIEARVSVQVREDACSEFVSWCVYDGRLIYCLTVSSHKSICYIWILVTIRQMRIVFMTDSRHL